MRTWATTALLSACLLLASGQAVRAQEGPDADLGARRLARMERELDLGRARARAGQTSLALAHFEDARRAHPAAPEPYLELGRTLKQLGRDGDAIAVLRAGRLRSPEHLPLTLALADALTTNGQPREALALLREAARRRPRSVDANAQRGELAASLGAWSEAAVAWSAVLDIAQQGGAVPPATLERARQMLGALALMLDDAHPGARGCVANEAPRAPAPGAHEDRWRRALARCRNQN